MTSAMMGLPLLSGPPPNPTDVDDNACRKCAKEFNVIFSRSRQCHHCGYSYCHSCSDFQALLPRVSSAGNGYDSVNVCAFCIEFLQLTAMGRVQLKKLPLSKLNKYINAYGIKLDQAVEKDDLVNAILNARETNGCLPIVNENFYRKYSVPSRTTSSRPRNIFSRLAGERSPPPPPPPVRPTNINQTHHFPRPDLAPDDPPPMSTHQPPPRPSPQTRPPPQHSTPSPRPSVPPRPSPPQQSRSNPYAHSPPQQPRSTPYAHSPPHRPGYRPEYTTPPPPRPQASRPNVSPYMPHSASSGARSSHNLSVPPQPNPSTRPSPSPATPRARTTSSPSPPTVPPPSLEELLNMTTSAISSLSVSALKAVLFNNRISTQGMSIIEKADLVKKVVSLVDDERKERAKRKEEEEREEQERLARLNNPNSPSNTFDAEKSGLCVVCQDADANIAIVDCGHLAMCKDCSDAIMASSKECPLCRTRIVTEARLLRIYKT